MDSRDEVALEELLVVSVEGSEEDSKVELLEDTRVELLEDSEELPLTVSSKLVSLTSFVERTEQTRFQTRELDATRRDANLPSFLFRLLSSLLQLEEETPSDTLVELLPTTLPSRSWSTT